MRAIFDEYLNTSQSPEIHSYRNQDFIASPPLSIIMSLETIPIRNEANAETQPTPPSPAAVAYKCDLRIEHRCGRITRTTIAVARKSEGMDSRKVWETIKRSLDRKEKVLAALELLGIRACAIPISEVGYESSADTDSVSSRVESLSDLANFELSTFASFFDELDDGPFVIRLTLFDKQPMLSMIGRGAFLLLTIGLQVGLAVV
ncbi:uncharacterized protein BJX67DRAFT_266737 [Aspergillus lucknowensis]|uniref:Uncharacterized protein n=1 Tax=Aspergillus lucknowensis TaxID=176173 RepID=A0ABR4LF97_9EURO